ncbi:universal stress protein [Gordonia sp. CPCC 206044]|uniref:universal stress protein n=1 Tax=Gordonia sp. CPCC 206044 TaxID=3140793 RepID=UPI003AF3467F
MTSGQLTRIHRSRRESTTATTSTKAPSSPHAEVIIGYSGTPASRLAIEAVGRGIVNPHHGVVIVCAVNKVHAPDKSTFMHDTLKSEAYLLSEGAELSELMRRAKECARAAHIPDVEVIAIEADPVRALASAVADHHASVAVVGMSGDRPSRQTRRIARALPDGVGMVATNGRTHTDVAVRRHVRPRLHRPAFPRTVARPMGV